MDSSHTSDSELLVRKSRRTMWLVLASICMLGIGAALNLMTGSTSLARFLPTMFTLVACFIGATSRGTSPANPAMRAILNDELRQASLARAQRNGLFAVMLIQAPMCLLLAVIDTPQPVALMACVSAFSGAAAVLISMLYYDR